MPTDAEIQAAVDEVIASGEWSISSEYFQFACDVIRKLNPPKPQGLCVSFTGIRQTDSMVDATGWVAFASYPPIVNPEDVEKLCQRIEKERGYRDVVILNFQRLETI